MTEPSQNDAVSLQRRLIHEHYGMAVIGGMVLEKALWVLLMTVENKSTLAISDPDKDFQTMLSKHRLWTFGRLLKELKKQFRFPEGLEAELEKAVNDRNYLVHHFILEKSKLLKSTEGLSTIDGELKRYYEFFVDLNKRCDKITEKMLMDALKVTDTK